MKEIVKIIVCFICCLFISSCVSTITIETIELSCQYVLMNVSTGESVIMDSLYAFEPYPELKVSDGDNVSLRLDLTMDGEISSSNVKVVFLDEEEKIGLGKSYERNFVMPSTKAGKYPLSVMGDFDVVDSQWNKDGYFKQTESCAIFLTSLLVVD